MACEFTRQLLLQLVEPLELHLERLEAFIRPVRLGFGLFQHPDFSLQALPFLVESGEFAGEDIPRRPFGDIQARFLEKRTDALCKLLLPLFQPDVAAFQPSEFGSCPGERFTDFRQAGGQSGQRLVDRESLALFGQ